MPRDDPLETNRYGELENPNAGLEEDVDLDEILEEGEEDSQLPPEGDFTRGEKTVEANSWKNRIKQYQNAAEELNINPDLVYEPANGYDISTAEAFPEADVLFAEIEDHNVEAVRNEGYEAILTDAERLSLSKTPDLVIFRNSAMDETKTLENNPAEYVFTNNWLGSASNVAEMDVYEMIGTIRQNETEFTEADGLEDAETPDDLYVFQRSK